MTSTAVAADAPPREGSRARLLAAAADAFTERGYLAVPVEEIAAAAGVSRMTFYRHFGGKAAIASALFAENSGRALPRLVAIGRADPLDRAAVLAWLAELFASDRSDRRLLRAFTQASVVEPAFTADAQRLIATLIARLGRTIPAFAVDRDDAAGARRWLEAWLLLYEILDQSNHAALDSGVATDPLILEILADRFVAFVAG